MSDRARGFTLAIPGPVWGLAPERGPHVPRGRLVPPGFGSYATRVAAIARAAAAAARRWRDIRDADFAAALRRLRADLRRDGLCPRTASEALGAVSAAAGRALGIEPYETQLIAACILLDGRLAEMATGEGKTLSVGLVACVAGLAGTPVHVITANDYLAARDAASLAPLFSSLGVEAACVTAGMAEADRREAYAAAITYTTARELVFDHLRDGLATPGLTTDVQRRSAALAGETARAPLLRGLCMAILDEADSILIDEATVALIISRESNSPDRRAFLWQSLAMARQLTAARDFGIEARRVELTPTGRATLQELAAGLRGAWKRRRFADEAVRQALTALHVLERDRDYVIRDGRVVPLDAVTGRAADGRVWSRGLHTLLELKERCALTPETETVARTTYQQFFPRYLHLCGMSGTLAESRGELGRVYGLRIARVPLRRANLRRNLGTRVFADADSRWRAVASRVAEMRAIGRPILIGTDSIESAEALAALLIDAGIEPDVLHARHDTAEAEIVARAGVARRVTVATRMAGRGTDIRLDPEAAAAGGLHVINCQSNDSARLDRQLAGRAGRQGDPGSVELCHCCDPRLGIWRLLTPIYRAGSWDEGASRSGVVTTLLVNVVTAFSKWRAQLAQARVRRHLLEQEREWSRQLTFMRRR